MRGQSKAILIVGGLSFTAALFITDMLVTSSVFGSWWPILSLVLVVFGFMVLSLCGNPVTQDSIYVSVDTGGSKEDCGYAFFGFCITSAFLGPVVAVHGGRLPTHLLWWFPPGLGLGVAAVVTIWKMLFVSDPEY